MVPNGEGRRFVVRVVIVISIAIAVVVEGSCVVEVRSRILEAGVAIGNFMITVIDPGVFSGENIGRAGVFSEA